MAYGLAMLLALLALVSAAASFLWQRRTREQLRRSEQRLRHALDATSEVVWDWNLVEDSMDTPSWARTYGFPPERTPRNGQELAAFIHPEDMAVIGAQVKELTEGKRDLLEVEHRALTGSGDWKWMVARARVVERDEAGTATRLIGTCADVTERKKLQTRLQIADRMASMGTLAAGVAHEINNPLAFMSVNLDFVIARIEAAERPPEVRGGRVGPSSADLVLWRTALAEALEGAHRVRDIVRGLKVFTRGDEAPPIPVDVNAVLKSALRLAEHELRQRARVVTRLDTVPVITGDPSRLSQVFLNLLMNAAQALPVGRAAEHEITVTTRSADGGKVAVEVSDTGCGIPPEHRGRIFDPFFTTKPVGVGTGLGLAICHGIVSGMQGEIEVDSTVGRGTTFRVLLPVTAAASGDAPDPRPRPPEGAPRDRRARVLVVDDEPHFCTAVARILSAEHEVETTCDPADALRRVRAGDRFDLFLTDLGMPTMSGKELYEQLRRVSPEQASRMLFMTGGALTAAIAEFAERQADRVLQKPLDADALRAAVADELRRLASTRRERVEPLH